MSNVKTKFQKVNLTINSVKETARIISFIRNTVKKAGFEKVVIGLSGGMDSSVSFSLSVKALGVDNVIGVMMPYGDWQKESVEDVIKLAKILDFPDKNLLNFNIKNFADNYLNINEDMDQVRKGNVMVRVRMIILYDLSKKFKALVIGTENRTEKILGYFTRFGDEASDIEAILHLYKTQVRQLADYLKIPDKIIKKPPTAGLWRGQTDEGEFGFSYAEADKILYLSIDKGLSQSE